MPDREKVIAGLNEVLSDLYMSVQPKHVMAITDTMALLKEQEPVPPKIAQTANGIYYVCANCGGMLPALFADNKVTVSRWPKFCPECGRELNWDA